MITPLSPALDPISAFPPGPKRLPSLTPALPPSLPYSLAVPLSPCPPPLLPPSELGKHNLMHNRLDEALRNDKKFQALYLVVTDLFVSELRTDLGYLRYHKDFLALPVDQREPYNGESSPHVIRISYAAKWVLPPTHGTDKQVHLASAIGMLLFPGDGVLESREKLQKAVLTPLRKVLKVPEVNMGQGTWKIAYTKVPARAMSRYSDLFMQRDPKGFEEYHKGCQGQKVHRRRLTIASRALDRRHEHRHPRFLPTGESAMEVSGGFHLEQLESSAIELPRHS